MALPLYDDLIESDAPERIATGFSFTEGPIWHPDGYLLFSDIPGNTIYKWTPDGNAKAFRSPSGHSNGLTFDKQGRLIVCEHKNRRVSRTKPDGTIVTLANEYEGKRLNSPNDVVVKSDGSIYFTDPTYGLGGGYRSWLFREYIGYCQTATLLSYSWMIFFDPTAWRSRLMRRCCTLPTLLAEK